MILTVTLNAAIDKRYVVEGARVGEVNRVKECAYTPGGKGLNVSKPAAVAGARVVATGFVGGHAGAYIEDSLKPFGIEAAFYHMKEESRSCINIWDTVNKVQTEYLEPGFTVSEEDFEGFLKKFRELVTGADVVTMSGSVPKGLDETAYQRLVGIVKDAGKKVILDTSGKLLAEGIKSGPTMIKPNIDAVNTVGCGDSMIAGFALGFSEGSSIEETLRKASAISAAALREETGFFVKEDMERIFPQIKIVKYI